MLEAESARSSWSTAPLKLAMALPAALVAPPMHRGLAVPPRAPTWLGAWWWPWGDPSEEPVEEAAVREDWVEPGDIEVVRAPGCKVKAPRQWAERLQEGTLSATYMPGNADYVAQLDCDPSCKVALRSVHANAGNLPELRAEEELAKQLRKAPHILQRFETKRNDFHEFVLQEPTDYYLEAVLARYPALSGEPRPLPVETSLPILADILHGVVALEKVGALHAGLTPLSVRIRDGRALIADLAGASRVQGWNVRFGRRLAAPRYAQPPESPSGYPTGPSCNIWDVGRIFAEMHIGGDVLQRAFLRYDPSAFDAPADLLRAKAEKFHETLAATFDIREEPAFLRLDWAVQEILRNLLHRAPEERWTASQALEEVVGIAQARGVALPKVRELPTLPGCWRDPPMPAWQ